MRRRSGKGRGRRWGRDLSSASRPGRVLAGSPLPSPPLVESHVFVPRAPLMPRILNYSAAAHTRVPPPSRNSSAIDSAQRDRRCISVFSISLSRFFPRILCNAEGTVYHAKWPSIGVRVRAAPAPSSAMEIAVKTVSENKSRGFPPPARYAHMRQLFPRRAWIFSSFSFFFLFFSSMGNVTI